MISSNSIGAVVTKSVLSSAVALLLGAGTSTASTITFNGLAGANGDPFAAYSEAGSQSGALPQVFAFNTSASLNSGTAIDCSESR